MPPDLTADHSAETAGQAGLTGNLMRGFFGACPACGTGRMFGRFLKVRDNCGHCGEELHHHRADDFPAYCVIFVVGHIVVPLTYSVELAFAPSYWVHAAIWLPLTLLLAVGLLQPIKGAIVALQWQLGMHGFEGGKRARDAASASGSLAMNAKLGSAPN